MPLRSHERIALPQTAALVVLALGLLFAWLTPTRGHHDLNYLAELAVVLAAGAMSVLAVRGHMVSGAVKVSLLPALLLCWPLCQVLLTLVRGVSVYPELLAAPVLALVAGLLLVGTLDQLRASGQGWRADRILSRTVLLGALLTAWTVLVQARLLPDPTGWVILPPPGIVPVSNFHQRNLAALLMSMGMAVLWHWRGTSVPQGRFCLQVVGTFYLALALALTQSRAGVLLPALGVACVALGRVMPATLAGRWRWLGWNLLGPVAVVVGSQVLVLWALQHVPTNGLSPVASVGTGVQRLAEGEGLAMRWQIMLHGVRQWMDQPLVGGGWGSHPGWLYLHAEGLPWPRYSTHTHNLLSHLLGETGLLGVLPLLGVTGALAWNLRRLRVGPEDPHLGMHLAFVVVVLVHSMVEYPLWNTYFLVPFCWSLVRLAQGRVPEMEWPGRRLSTLLSLGGVFLVTAGALCLWALLGAIDTRFAEQSRQAQIRQGASVTVSAVTGHSYFDDVIRYADPVTDSRMAMLRRPLGERLALAAPMDWILERLAVDQALTGDAAASATTFVRLCAMYRHRCQEVLGRLELLSGQAALFAPIRAEVQRRVNARLQDPYDLPLIR